jgi:putative phosphoesterase
MPRGGRRLPEACEREIAAADLLVHLGDFSHRAVLDSLSALAPRTLAVHGNVDSAELRELLPADAVEEAGGVRLGLIHDAGPRRGRLARMRARFPDADAVLFGHSHLPLHESEGDFQIFNPGSPTERRRAPHRTMGRARIENGSIAFEHVVLD